VKPGYHAQFNNSEGFPLFKHPEVIFTKQTRLGMFGAVCEADESSQTLLSSLFVAAISSHFYPRYQQP
jgi:hypothetical protein